MASKSFISARLPKELLERVESFAEETGGSKSGVLIDALENYLGNQESPDSPSRDLEDRVLKFERWIDSRVSRLEDKVKTISEVQSEPLKAGGKKAHWASTGAARKRATIYLPPESPEDNPDKEPIATKRKR